MISRLSIFMIVLASFVWSCQSTDPQRELIKRKLSKHHKIVEAHTRKLQRYNGLQSAFEFSTTQLTQDVLDSEWNLKQLIYRWSDEELASEMESFNKKNGTDSKVFLSFFTPTRKQNNLEKKHSKWRIYMIVGDRKFAGIVKKRRDLFDDITAFYPMHTRWSKPYLVSFPGAPKNAEAAKVVITGPLESAEVQF